ncbi:Prolipoprotein diacylglyceryl transferase [Candidatus Izimaplasma bacterium HR1]|jgi:phosphatidylglycerol:prolipoprotein diacylglycerol transferase|uniref:prolipoprotein diacylglyceryl transferase n=1 Tax=Candidatus Izimoplasma sp. HR1 TaxID=1541959 RepID=UPI0004F68EFD|nr:Prolipoprotein diacylglyceryl transferase [Candidatus Izimaplasma bacterium HR1]
MLTLIVDHVFDPIPNIFLDLGFITWYKYSVMIMSGIIIAAVLGLFEGKKLGINKDVLLDGLLIIVPLSIVGTRLWYVVFEWDKYAWDIMKIINITDGGLAIHGGFITAFVSAYFFTKWKKVSIFGAFDLMAPGFLIAQAMGRWGNFFNQEAHGGVIGGSGSTWDAQRAFLTDKLHLPDFITNNMFLYGNEGLNYYHPTFLYESLWNVAGFILMLVLRRTKKIRQGDLLAFYLIWYSAGRYFIEAMRTDSLYILNTGIRTAQLISILMIIGGIVLAVLLRTVIKQKKYHVALEQNKVINDFEDKMNEYKNSSVNEETDVEITTKFLILKEVIDKQKDDEWLQGEHPEITEFEDELNKYKELSLEEEK